MDPTDSAPNGITRRNFMKKTALTTGAVMVLSRGFGFAGENDSKSFTYDTWVSHSITGTISVTGEGNPGSGGAGDAATDANRKLADELNNGGNSTSSTSNQVTTNHPPNPCFKFFTVTGAPNQVTTGPAYFDTADNKWKYTITVMNGSTVKWQYQE